MNSIAMATEPVFRSQLEGACNFRDLGGLETRDGRIVKRGMIFRTDEMSRLTDADLRYLSALPLRTIVDLRTKPEIARRPNRKPASLQSMEIGTLDTPRCLADVANLHDDSILNSVDKDIQNTLGNTDAKMGTLPEEQIRVAVIKLYGQMTAEPDFIAVYRRIFALLLQDDAVPLVFHCMAGKDRTGIVAALILSALNVDEEEIMRDYLLSNVVAEKKYSKQLAVNHALRYLYEAHPEFLQAAFERIRNDHGTVQNYLRKILGADIEKMQERYLD